MPINKLNADYVSFLVHQNVDGNVSVESGLTCQRGHFRCNTMGRVLEQGVSVQPDWLSLSVRQQRSGAGTELGRSREVERECQQHYEKRMGQWRGRHSRQDTVQVSEVPKQKSRDQRMVPASVGWLPG